MMGTLDYMAPEQAIDFRTVDIRADIYSLGCTFYFMLAGQAPFPQGTPAQKLLLHQMKEPEPVEQFRRDLSPVLASIIRRMMAKRADDRFQTPAEVAAALLSATPGSHMPLSVPSARALVPVSQGAHGPILAAALPVAQPVGETLQPIKPVRVEVLTQDGRLVIPSRRWLALVPRPARLARRWRLWGALAVLLVVTSVGIYQTVKYFARVNSERKAASSSPAVTYLSDLKPIAVLGTIAGDNFTINGELAGARMVVNGQLILNGIGATVIPNGVVAVKYALGRRYRALQAGVAVNDGKAFGNLRFVVLVDGKQKWESTPRRKGEVQNCNVSVEDGELLELLIMGNYVRGEQFLQGIWIQPQLIQ
jgi:hypothetical protein